MPRQGPLAPVWRKYNVAYLVRDYLERVEAHHRERTELEKVPQYAQSPSILFRKNRHTPGMKTAGGLLDAALEETGPVQYEGRLYTSSTSAWHEPIAADASIQGAETINVEILAPFNRARRCE